MFAKLLLSISAIVFVTYGLVCFFAPEVPAGYAGLVMTNGDAYAEIGAMYGGLQTGFGVFCAIAALRNEYTRAGLLLLAICIGTLALGRLYSMLVGGNPVGFYTYGAFTYELATAVLAAVALRINSSKAA